MLPLNGHAVTVIDSFYYATDNRRARNEETRREVQNMLQRFGG